MTEDANKLLRYYVIFSNMLALYLKVTSEILMLMLSYLIKEWNLITIGRGICKKNITLREIFNVILL